MKEPASHFSSANGTSVNPENSRQEFESLAADLAVKIMGDETLRGLFQAVFRKLLSDWAGKNPLKRLSAALAARAVPGMPSTPEESEADSLAARLGQLLTCYWTIRAEETGRDPQAAADQATAFVREFMENTDFSRWKQMVEESHHSRVNLFEAVNQIMPDYSGKMLVFMATLPTLISTVTAGLRSFLETQLAVMPPDMLYEVFSGTNEQIDWHQVGGMLNDYHELINRFQIGSALFGDGETPALQSLTADILSDIAASLDRDKLAAARSAAARNREAIDNGLSSVMTSNPEFGQTLFSTRVKTINSRIRAAKNRLRVMAEFPDDSFERLLCEVNDNFEALELADLLSVCGELAIRVRETRPDLISSLLSRIVDSIDTEGLRQVGSLLSGEISAAVKPVALPLLRPLVPVLINGLCEMLSPHPDGHEKEDRDALVTALARLGRIIKEENAGGGNAA